MHLKEKPSNLSTDGESRSLSEANLVTKPKAELPNLFARRSRGNWTRTCEPETPSALCTPTSSSFASPCGLGASEHKLAAS